MPTYTYKCKECGNVEEAFRSIDNRKDGPECCNEVMDQIIVPAHIQPVLGGGSFQGYMCPVTDTFVTSRKQRKEIMARHGMVEKG